MTSARPVFGDFLDIAHRQLDRSSSDAQVRGGEDLGEACRSLRRLVVVLERHAGDLLGPRKMGPDAGRDQSAWDQVPASACRALNHAAAVLSQSQVRPIPVRFALAAISAEFEAASGLPGWLAGAGGVAVRQLGERQEADRCQHDLALPDGLQARFMALRS